MCRWGRPTASSCLDPDLPLEVPPAQHATPRPDEDQALRTRLPNPSRCQRTPPATPGKRHGALASLGLGRVEEQADPCLGCTSFFRDLDLARRQVDVLPAHPASSPQRMSANVASRMRARYRTGTVSARREDNWQRHGLLARPNSLPAPLMGARVAGNEPHVLLGRLQDGVQQPVRLGHRHRPERMLGRGASLEPRRAPAPNGRLVDVA